jgi:multidrug efflux pump
MFSRFFIDRPIFATVLSMVITLAGAIAVYRLPLAQYPPVTPPTVQVNCSYAGASAQVVAETVAAPIEQQVNGVENMLYMVSQCANDGSYNLTVTFKHGVDLNLAQVLVQNRVNLALPKLPNVLKQSGVVTRKMSTDFLMSINLNSPHGRYDQLYLSNYALMHLRDELLRVPGISDIRITGQRDYSMRIWVDPEKLAARNLTANDVVAALREQNAQVAAGQIGQEPVSAEQKTQITLSTLGRLETPEQFGDIVIRTDNVGRAVRIKDVARVELGAKNQDTRCKLDGKQSVGLVTIQLPDANALEVSSRVKAKMDELSKFFPKDMIYEIQYDTTPYTRQCIKEVFLSLRDAIILVAFVVLLFLQNWRSAIIPLIAVPVAIIGTFAVMAAMGFSLNNLTLFGLVLAIGIVVDDAIVVVEAVEHHIENGLNPRDATIKAMSQVSGPVIAVGLVLSAVFVPCAFISGLTGQFFRQFALTIASSTIISAFNSLTLSPALAAMFLQERDHDTHEALPRLAFPVFGGWLGYLWLTPWLNGLGTRFLPGLSSLSPEKPSSAIWWGAVVLGIGISALLGHWAAGPINHVMRNGFRKFNAAVKYTTTAYTRVVGLAIRLSVFILLVYGGLLFATYWGFTHTPKGFIPNQDMGNLSVSLQLPDAASAERTAEITSRVQKICMSTPGVRHTLSVSGTSMVLNISASNFGFMFVILDDFPEREKPGYSADEIAAVLRARCAKEIPEAAVMVLPPAPIRGVGRTGGFKLMVEDRGDLGLTTLQQQADNLAEKGRQQKSRWKTNLLNIAPNAFRANSPQLFVDVNRAQCMTMGVPLSNLFNTLQIYLGSLYVNDFNLYGRTWQVIVQADAQFRNQIDKVKQLKVRNSLGVMTPIGSLADIRDVNGPLVLTRYNMYPAAAIQGTPGPRVSSRQAIDLMEQLADQNLLPAMHCEWTELAFLELQAGNTAMVIFFFAIIMVFLVLAAQYESWAMPLAVILVVPMCLLSAVIGVSLVPIALYYISLAIATLSSTLAYTVRGVNSPSDINIFTQVGFVVLVGLASKNAILIVEFAKHRREEGVSRYDAALAACRLRFRPIVMTSFAFILGVIPLLIAHGAGSEMRRTLGTAVFSGMLGVTLFGIFLTPVFFTVVDWFGQSDFFQSRWMRWIRFFTLGIFAMGFLRMLFRYLAQVARDLWHKLERSIPPDDTNTISPDATGVIPPDDTDKKP